MPGFQSIRFESFYRRTSLPRAGAQTFADSGSACREGGGSTRENYRPSFEKIRDRARYRQGRFAPPPAVAYGKP